MFSVRRFSLALLIPLTVLAREPMAPPPALPPETSPAPQRTLAALPSIAADASVYSIDGTDGPPTDEETLYLEYINRARLDPSGEGARLRNTADPEVKSTYTYFDVDLAKMQSEFEALSPVPPLAFNAKLLDAARAHTQDMFDHTYQGHTGSDGSTLVSRANAAGYSYSFIAENVFSYSESVFYGHAGFEVDWGQESDGMQIGRGHRANIHHLTAREIGVGVVLGTKSGNDLTNSPTTVGPQLVTQEFGNRSGLGPLLTGVAYFDFSGDNFYSVGEGIGGVSVTVAGANYSAITSPSGAFTVPLPGAGTYTVTFSGLGFNQSANVTSTADSNGPKNVKLDFTPTYVKPVVSGPTSIIAGAPAAFSFTSATGATGYTVTGYLLANVDTTEPAESLADVTLDVSSDYSVLQSAVKSQGNSAFRLYHALTAQNTQSITLNQEVFLRAGSSLVFSSRLATAATTDTVAVEITTDNGATWTQIYAQAGTNTSGELQFSARTADLSAFANRVAKVRFSLHSMSSFSSTGPVGWYVDDIQFKNSGRLSAPITTSLSASATSFNYTAPGDGSYLLSLVPQNVTRNLPAADPMLVTAAAFTGTAASIAAQPTGAAVTAGTAVSLSVAAAGTAPLSYQWSKDGTTITGATNSTLTLPNAATTDSGNYTVTVSNGGGSVTSDVAAVLVRAVGDNGTSNYLSNLSVRARMVQSQTLIVGFVVSGGSKPILIRAAGPALLTTFGLNEALPDPRLTLYDSTNTGVSSNDDWPAALASTFSTLGAFSFVNGSKDAALLATISGPHTAHATGTGSGIVLVEAYDAGLNDGPTLVNLSARSRAGTGDDILIAGFVVAGSGHRQVLLRGVGPGLNSKFGLTGYLADPQLNLYTANGQLLAHNDNWSAALAPTFSNLGAFDLVSGSQDAALVVTLSAGEPYTVQVSGVGGTTGEALVEVYAIP